MIKLLRNNTLSLDDKRVNPLATYKDGIISNTSQNVVNYYKSLAELSRQDNNWMLDNFGYGGAEADPKAKFAALDKALKKGGTTRSPINFYGNPLIDINFALVKEEDQDGKEVEVIIITLTFLYEVHTYAQAEDNSYYLLKDLYVNRESLNCALLLPLTDEGAYIYLETMGKDCEIGINKPDEENGIPSVFQMELYALKTVFPPDFLRALTS